MKIEEEPLFHMDELNPQLYEHVMCLKDVKVSFHLSIENILTFHKL